MIRGGLAAVAAAILLAASPAASPAAQSPRMVGVAATEEGGAILASGELSLWLTKEVKEAIDGSLPVTVRYRAEVYSERKLWDKVLGRAEVTKAMRYDRVKESFLLSRPDAGGTEAPTEATNAAEAQRWLSTLARTPVVTVASLAPGRRYQLRVRAEIELSRRSFPLNLLLFFVPDRNERTDWEVSPPFAAPGAKRP